METENNYKNSFESVNGSNREGATNSNNGEQQPRQRQRVRISRPANASVYGSSSNGTTHSNSSSYSNNSAPRRPYDRDNNSSYHKPYNNNRGENGYSSQRRSNGYNSYDNNSHGGYQQRPYRSYNNDGNNSADGATTQRTGGYQSRSYGNRPNGNSYGQQRSGGYGNNNRAGGYNKFNNNGGKGGYQRRPRTADYDPNAKYSLKKRIEYNENNIDPTVPIRLNKYLANAGVCSRREADEFIEAGVVSVNGEVVTTLGTKVMRSDEVKFHDQPVRLEKKVYVLLNKPKNCVTTSDDPQQRQTVMDLVKGICPERIYPVGRLDRNTTGVLLLTNDGELATKLTHPQFKKKKVYHVVLDKNVTAADMQQIADGIMLEDGEVHADAIEYASPTSKAEVGIEIHSGRNRIVRRIFDKLGYHVIKLDRVLFAGLTKKNLKRGDWRFLTEKEVDMLRMGAFE